MRSIIEFVAYKRSGLKYRRTSKQELLSASVELTDAAFEELSQYFDIIDYRTINVMLDESSEKYRLVVDLIFKDIGKLPNEYVGIGIRRGAEYSARRSYIYSSEELDHAPALLLIPTPGFAKFDEIQDGIPPFKASSLSSQCFGAFYPSWRFGASLELGARMKECDFKGLGLVEIAIKDITTQTSSLYWLNPTVRLPRSKLDLCDIQGKPIDTQSKSCYFVAKSDPMILVYNDVEFGDAEFDIAYTHEKTGPNIQGMYPYIVISQAFRKFLLSHVDSKVEFAPIQIESVKKSHVKKSQAF